MNLKYLKNHELDQSFGLAANKERKAIVNVVNHIVEIERRKLYLDFKYPSLFVYLTEHLKYSNGTAQRRIDAARLITDIPSLTEKLESGELNLGQVTIVQKAIRQKKKEVNAASKKSKTKKKSQVNAESMDLFSVDTAIETVQPEETQTLFSREEKVELIESILGKTEKESQILVSQALNLEVKAGPKVVHQKDESVRLEVTLSKDQWAKLERSRELLSTSLPDGHWDQVLEYMADQIIEKKTKVTARAKPSDKNLKETTKKQVKNRDGSACVVCNSKWNTQTDHIQPLWDGGKHELENLQTLCAAHNQKRYRDQAGIRFL